jgi:hypothetical protein
MNDFGKKILTLEDFSREVFLLRGKMLCWLLVLGPCKRRPVLRKLKLGQR